MKHHKDKPSRLVFLYGKFQSRTASVRKSEILLISLRVRTRDGLHKPGASHDRVKSLVPFPGRVPAEFYSNRIKPT